MDRADRPPRQSPLWLSVVSVALIVVAVIGALAATQRLTFSIFGAPVQDALSAPITVSTVNTVGLIHPQDAAFSPDGTRIAVIGAFTPCQQLVPGLPRCGHGLVIYDSAHGGIVQMSPIEPLLGVTIPGVNEARAHGSAGYVWVRGLGWSPDSVWFAMTYTVFSAATPTSPNEMLDSGLLLLNPQTGATQVIRGDSGYFASLVSPSVAHPVWHITGSPETTGFTTAPGIIFAWGQDGLPFPTVGVRGALDELPANAGARYPVGQPDGSAPFTIWQPGVVIGPGSAGVGGGRGAFVTTFASWSADGAHVTTLTEGVTLPTPVKALSAVSAPSGTAGPVLAEPSDMPAVPARDVALAHVQEAVGAYGWAAVAWNPAGSALASVTCFARQGQAVELRDTASGAVIGSSRLKLGAGDPGCADPAASNLSLLWSPDGSRLLAVDAQASTLTLWRVSR
ncbi:MAG TPA: hypothetical protein VFU60_09365 [Ktedonobacterales bacterium]|nr:hypothetical protein [Ktedonobacterales bacterium]